MTHHCAALRAVVAVGRIEPQAAHGVKHGGALRALRDGQKKH